MSWRAWPKTDDKGLARYVLPSAVTELRLPAQPATLPQDPASRRALVEAIYAALVEKRISYSTEDYQPALDRQRIRAPKEVLDSPGVGTCLDLAALFCGLCLGRDLLPLLIVLDDHAFAAVSLTHNRREWQSRTRQERALFEDGVLRAARTEDLKRLLDEAEGAFLPIECTGFSRSESLSEERPEGRGRDRGLLSFERAIAAAREHLAAAGRRLLFAIDVASLHYGGFEPPPPWSESEALAEIRGYGGATALRLDYRSETADILRYYEARFVGRDEELKAVFDFVSGRGPLAGGSYALIQAPGGFGKSAFMVHLVRQAQTGQWMGQTPHVVYFFVRRQGRRNTAEAFLQAVNSQLLGHLGVPGGTPVSLFELKAQFTQLWAAVEAAASPESPLLLLVDGLDEMAPPGSDGGETIADLLPSPASEGIRVLVSSRPHPAAKDRVRREHPLAAAGVIELRTFDLGSVRSLLESVVAGVARQRPGYVAPMAAADVDTVAERVLHLTKGEPLFARFVCEEVVQGGVEKLDALEKSPPSDVEDYFRREMGMLRAAQFGEESWRILGLLCVAAGPLSREELAGITQEPARRLDPALDAIFRYLLGERRFELMHPRLRNLIANDFTPDELRTLTDRILAWCAAYQKRGWPADTPDYVLEHYAAHLAALGDPAPLFGLLDKSWMVCHREREGKGADSGFVRDAALATETALRGPARHWIPAFRGTLVLATLRSVAGDLPSSVIACLARSGHWEEAESYAELLEDPILRCEVFARLAQAALDQGSDAEARRLSRAALDALSRGRELLGELESAFLPLCDVLVRLGDIAGLAVLAGAARIGEGPEEWAAGALAAVVAACSRSAEAERVQDLLTTNQGVDLFLGRVVDLAIENGDMALLRAVVSLGVGGRQAGRLAVMASAQHGLGDSAQARRLAAQAISKVRKEADLNVCARLLSLFARHGMSEAADEVRTLGATIAPRLLRDQYYAGPSLADFALAGFARALADARDADGLAALDAAARNHGQLTGDLDELLAALAGSHARLGRTASAKAAASALETEESDGSYEAIAWQNIVEGLCRAGRLDEALQAAGENRFDSRVAGFGLVVEALGNSGRPVEAMALARRAITEARGLIGERPQVEAYANLSRAIAERGDISRARQVLARAEAEIASISRGGLTLGTTRAMAQAYAWLGDFDRAQAIRLPWKEDAELLRLLLEQARAAGRADVVAWLEEELLAQVSAAEDAGTLLVAADIHGSAGRTAESSAALEQAFEIARHDFSRFSALCNVLKAAAVAGESGLAKRVLRALQRSREWTFLAQRNGEADAATNQSEEEEVFVNASEAVMLAEALHALDHQEEARLFIERGLALARDDGWAVSTSTIESLALFFAGSGQLRQRIGEITSVIDRQAHDWQKAGMLTGVARVALQSGDRPLAEELLAQALRRAATGGRLAVFEVISGVGNGLQDLEVPDLEWTIFETCEEIDGWWQPTLDEVAS